MQEDASFVPLHKMANAEGGECVYQIGIVNPLVDLRLQARQLRQMSAGNGRAQEVKDLGLKSALASVLLSSWFSKNQSTNISWYVTIAGERRKRKKALWQIE